MKYWTVLLSFSLFAASAVWAGDLPIAPAPDCHCAQSGNDPFEQPVRFNFGFYNGKCVDSCRFRGARSVPASVAHKYGEDADHVVIANVLHDSRYWIAKIPVQEVEEIDLGFEEFLPHINHVLLRFRFSPKKPVKLFSQNPAEHETQTLTDLVISAEGVPPQGQPYDFWESSRGRYLLGYRVMSLHDISDRMIKKLKHSVAQYHLDLSAADRRKILLTGLRASEEKSFNTVYNLFLNNCATSAVGLLVDASALRWMISNPFNFPFLESGLPLTAPFGTLRILESRGLVKPTLQGRRPNLETESSIQKLIN